MTKFRYISLLAALFVVTACSKGGSTGDNGSTNTTTTIGLPASFAKGADISWVTQMESAGYKFYNNSGAVEDCFQLMKDKGMNAIRLRVWVNPSDGWCNKADLLAKAIRANNLGMKIMIDFHYSDVWADPAHQTKPAAWVGQNIATLQTSVYNHTVDVLSTLKTNGITPVWVQVGNETNDGMLWEDGRASTNMANFALLVNAGYNAVKFVNSSIKVIVHISNGYDNSLFRWMFDGLKANNANYDIIGMSLYPSTSNWATLDGQCLTNMNDMVSRYGKPVMICEIGMDVNSPAITNSFITDIITKVNSVPNGNGLGVFYWEPEAYNWQSYSMGAFDNSGRPTTAMDAFSIN
ncbi:glycosyl hydrolase 53 family protein [uncultured Mucilaginibacter sp.]|uniref:glycoside hydrolase family 53 protein n=1 Tax=uncultured Mucilaginibacter sp. TaxID=797541 RepID=UPI0025D72071|nr:glycosyl hydrolase 53 family protein [uncultured Mucilaginibacter sp.]